MTERKEIRYEIPEDACPSQCRGCHAVIYWVKTPKGKNMPVDPDGVPHWGTCRKATDFKALKEAAK